MAKFCGKCGSRLDEATGLCPRCDAPILPEVPAEQIYYPAEPEVPEAAPKSRKERKQERKEQKKAAKKQKKRDKKAAKKAKKKAKRAQWSTGKKIRRFFLKVFLILLLLAVLAGGAAFALDYFGLVSIPFIPDTMERMGILPEDNSNDEFSHLNARYTEVRVVDEDSAIQAAKDAAKVLNLGNAADELQVEDVSTVGDNVYYRLQQYYQGVPVYGRTMVVIADTSGDAEGFSSNAVEITNVSNADKILSKESLTEKVREYYITKGSISSDTKVQLANIDKADLMLYPTEDSMCYAYQAYVFVDDNPLSSGCVIVNAQNGEVRMEEQLVYEESVDCYNASRSMKVSGNYDDASKEYWLQDNERGIRIYSHENTNSKSPGFKQTFITSQNEVFGDTAQESQLEVEKGVELLYYGSRVRDYYTKLSEPGFDKVYLFYNDGYDSGNNALGGCPFLQTGEQIGRISIGSNRRGSELDLIGHEYTHVITGRVVKWIDVDTSKGATDEPGAINEGYSDIFGELIQAEVSKRPIDWVNGRRVMSDPMSVGYPARIGDKECGMATFSDGTSGTGIATTGFVLFGQVLGGGTDYAHGYSTVVSHCAYQMSIGVDHSMTALTTEELTNLWYNTMLTLPSNCTFVVLRENMKMTAEILGFNEDKRRCISAAFDAVGILPQETEETVNKDSKLLVYDRNGKLYDNYSVTIEGEAYTGWFKWGWFTDDYEQQIDVSTPQEVQLSLPVGKFTITVTDGADDADGDSQLTKEIKTDSDSKTDSIILTSQFGEPETAEEIMVDRKIPVGAVQFNGHNYYIYEITMINTWEDVCDYCESVYGYPATISSKAENDFLYSYITKEGYENAHFGFTDEAVEGDWKWTNGEPVVYTNWHSGEPNDSNSGEDYAEFYKNNTDGTWNDTDFGTDTTAFICEWGSYSTEEVEASAPPTRTTSDERDIVLTLDTSGSMYGDPIDQTILASEKFIQTILKEDASIGVVNYEDYAEICSDFSMNESALKDIVSSLSTGGSTNIEDGLATAYSMLSETGAKKKIIVLMSDGEPNEGKQGEELIAYANQLKADGVKIYTLGFFEDLGGYRSEAQALMEAIASEGCHYEVADADDLVFFFGDMADQINGQKYIYIRIACPVDVTVSYDGETLCSSERDLNVRTSFGSLTFEDDEESETGDQIKVLRLKEGADYDVKINGTGRGSMDYTIGFMDDDGEYDDFRRFENIRITRRTMIDTVAAVSKESTLNIDDDGDGKYDLRLRAKENGYGEEIKSLLPIYFMVVGAALLLTIVLIIIERIRTKREKKKGY